eukprot:3268695-Rhodomonas_salina.1
MMRMRHLRRAEQWEEKRSGRRQVKGAEEGGAHGVVAGLEDDELVAALREDSMQSEAGEDDDGAVREGDNEGGKRRRKRGR